MKYRVTHTCGHTYDYNLDWKRWGGQGGAEEKISEMAKKPCLECYKQEAKDKTSEFNEQALLPPIEGGSPKQNQWAESIRRKHLSKVGTLVRGWEQEIQDAETYGEPSPKEFPLYINAAQRLLGLTQATFWINNRSLPTVELIKKIARTTSAAFNG